MEYTKINLPLLMSKHRLEQEKLQVAHKLGDDKLKKLISDRDAMIVKAPIDGIVYYGRSLRGKWSAMSVETLRRGTQIMPNEVFMTVVQTRPLVIRTTVPESQVATGPYGPAGRRRAGRLRIAKAFGRRAARGRDSHGKQRFRLPTDRRR